MAKGFTQKDLMVWTMQHSNGTKHYYVIEKAPFEAEGVKKSVHLPGSKDAVFKYLDQAEAALKSFPPGEETAAAGAPAAETSAAEEPAEA